MSDPKHTVGCRSNTGRLREAVVKRPRDAFSSQAIVDAEWASLGYSSAPDLMQADAEFDALLDILRAEGVRLHFLPADGATDLDSLYTHDPVTAVGGGLVLCRMGKTSRRGEPGAVERFARQEGLPVVGRIQAPGLLEGGDIVWLDQETVAVGVGYRSNEEGARQLSELANVQVIRVPLPHWNGPSDVLHLMSLLSPVSASLAVVYRRLLPVTFLQELAARGIGLVDVPDQEFETLGCNVLALAPGRCLVLEGNPVTACRLRESGCSVLSFRGAEIALKGLGGPTCLTRPTHRD
jgi:arginine deiminase